MSTNSLNNLWFLSRLSDIVQANLGDENFGVSQLAEQSGKSRSHIHRYLKEHTNESISHFISRMRLERAMVLLKENSSTVSEIAYDVGFRSPSYFIKCFHEKYGYSPGEVKKKLSERSFVEKNKDTEERVRRVKFSSPMKITAIKISIVTIFVIAFIGVLWYLIPSKEDSIIVLPFENYSNNPEIDYFAAGIQEDILSDLDKIADLRIVSRTSTEQFRNSKLSILRITRKMRVKYALEGSVRWHDGDVKLTTQLIRAGFLKEDHVWTGNFNRKLDDFIGIQDEIALQVALNVRKRLTQQEIDRIQKQSTQNPKAYDHYLRARFFHHKAIHDVRSGFDQNSVVKSIDFYEMAIAEDENYVDAYAGLANANFQLTAWKIIPSRDGFIKAKQLCDKAIEIDPDCAEAHCILGAFYIWGQRNFKEGKKSLQNAIRLNPNFATTRQIYAQFLQITGPIEEAREQVNRALELEPHFWVVLTLDSWIYYFEEKYAEALDACILANDYNPNFSSNQWLCVLNYSKLGEGEKMMQQLQMMVKRYTGSDEFGEEIQLAYEASGIEGLFLWMIETNKNNPIKVEGLNGHPYFIAWWYTLLKDKENALYWLEKIPQQKRIPWHYFNLIATNPDFDFLRNEPRFIAIIDEIGLTSYHYRAKTS